MTIVILLAIIMAIFGIIGYQRGIWPQILSLVIFVAVFAVVERRADAVIRYTNALFKVAILMAKSGFTDLSAGDVEATIRKWQGIEKPFVEEKEGYALLVLMFVAAISAYLLGRLIKKKVWPIGGAIMGILNGYILSAAFLPWLTPLSEGDLPVPLIREGEGLAVDVGQKAGEAASKLPWSAVLDWLTLKGGLPLIILMALLFMFAMWRMRTKKA